MTNMRKLLIPIFSTFLLILLPGLILSACGQVFIETAGAPSILPTSALPTNNLLASPTSFLPATITPTFPDTNSPVETITETATLTETSTETLTEIPTETLPTFTYIFPVQPSKLASFAEGVASHGYPATDIFAPEGTKFVAVTSGVVDFVSTQDTWDPVLDDPASRGGLSIAIIGDDGVRYYGSHLSAIQTGIRTGIRVAAGQVLGFIGHTGDARNTDSHLHFGISRPTTPDDWKARRGQVDPFPFLVAWRAGQNLTPPLPSP